MTPYYEDADVTLFLGDCVDVMAQMAPKSVDAICTDPPYGLEFMGKEWDKLQGGFQETKGDGSWAAQHGTTRKGFDGYGLLPSYIQPVRNIQCPDCGRWRDGRDPDKPDKRKGYRCACGGAQRLQRQQVGLGIQTWHHTWALEALRVLKPGGHMVAFGGTRTHHRLWCAVEDAGFEVRDCLMFLHGVGFPKSLDVSKAIDKAAGAKREKVQPGNPPAYQRSIGNTRPWMDDPDHKIDSSEPATDAARQWQGWGTALKPAWEPILLARKPIERNVAHNVQKHGTGALNVDGCRVGVGDERLSISKADPFHAKDGSQRTWNPTSSGTIERDQHPSGRWPANLVLDEEAAAMLDAQSGDSISSRGGLSGKTAIWGKDGDRRQVEWEGYSDSGGASRFFYTSKAGASERGGTKHPTVKPRDLMLWLCKLITPPGGLILDPFIGSGTTAVAAIMGGFRCIGIDNNEEYLSHARERLRLGDEGLCQVNEARKQGSEQGVLW